MQDLRPRYLAPNIRLAGIRAPRALSMLWRGLQAAVPRLLEALVALKQVAADDQVVVSIRTDEDKAPPSPMRPDIMKAFEQITDSMWPGVITVPEMSTGASDGRYLREAGIPTYGIQGFFLDRDDVRAHGRDERMPVQSFYEGQTFLYELVKRLSTAN